MQITIVISLALALLVQETTVVGQGSQENRPPSNLAHELRKTVGFLTTVYQDARVQKKAEGTCFLIALEDPRIGPSGFTYLVTNRHVAAPELNGRRVQVISASVRLNQKQSGRGDRSVEIPLRPNWYFPADESVDLALMPFAADSNLFDVLYVSSEQFATRDLIESRAISEGDPIIMAGYFYLLPGRERIQPIVRQGILAMLPDEKVQTTTSRDGTLYLGDLHVLGGNSGSPVFIKLGGSWRGRFYATEKARLIGIVSGYFYEDEELKLRISTLLTGDLKTNSGISAIVPVDELVKLLNLPELKSMREAAIKSLQSR